jgi:zinc protease
MRRTASYTALLGIIASACLGSIASAQPIDRTVPPRLAPPTALTMPASVERTLPNGLRLVIVEQRKLPLLDAVLVLRHGSEADPAGKEGLASLTASLLREGTATLIIVGDISADEAERRARALFGEWQRAPLPAIASSAAPAPSSTGITLIDKPGAPQSSFRLGSVAVARNTPDYHALMVLNTVLGGSFTSRLNNNLRETKGYTYGAGSSFAMRRDAGPFSARAEIVAEKSDSALLEFMKELRAIREPLSTTELEKAKQYLILGFAERFETTGDVASQLASLVAYDLPLDTWSGFQRGVERVAASDVQRVATQYINPQALRIVIVGDRASIEAPLRATNVAPLQIRDAMGREVPRP